MKSSLYGLKNTNRNFDLKESWGKNQFNSSFPASLCCYFYKKKLSANYIIIEDEKTLISEIKIEDLLGAKPDDLFFSFESIFENYSSYVNGSLPRNDLVLKNLKTKKSIRSLEIKLTAIPDETTFNDDEENYGSEIVVRPDTIVYLVCSIIKNFKMSKEEIDSLKKMITLSWTDNNAVLNQFPKILEVMNTISISNKFTNDPLILQPIWKTKGKSPTLDDNCLDIFVWSSASFLNFITKISKAENYKNINRPMRTVIWVFKMLLDYITKGKFDYKKIFDTLSYSTRNDKAFASSGKITNKFMYCKNLIKPRIKKNEIKHIILNNGHEMLSPERRFDAVIFNDKDLF
ncbi:HindVP family restriction endonuclease [Pelagibacteraceae bacterium]|nr:HindVP family restriction endonuclease [Pelagibacteraceae bacterium]